MARFQRPCVLLKLSANAMSIAEPMSGMGWCMLEQGQHVRRLQHARHAAAADEQHICTATKIMEKREKPKQKFP